MQCIVREVVFDGANINNLPFYGDGYSFTLDAAERSLTGIERGGTDLEEIKLFNNSPGTVLRLPHNSSDSSAGNRFYLIGETDRLLNPGVPYWLVYKENGPSGSGWYGEATEPAP